MKEGRECPGRVNQITAHGIKLICILAFVSGCSSQMTAVKDQQPPFENQPQHMARAEGSLWPGENAVNSFFIDNKARQVNDIVTIVVSESATGTSSASTNTSREATTTTGIASLLGLDKSLQAMNENLKPKIEVGGSASNALKGQGDTSRDSKLATTLTARVLKVLENGNLYIEGRRQLTMNGEDQYVVLSGTIRPDDITTDNVIYSQYIADAQIYYTGKGVINSKMRAGWLTRVLDTVWPF